MGKLQTLANSFKNINIDNDLDSVIHGTALDAIQLNQDQLQDGQHPDGSSLPDYSDRSVDEFGKRPGPWTLEDTGSFYRGFTLATDNARIRISSSDNKTGLLLGISKGDIFGLQDSNIKIYARQYILPNLLTLIRQQIKS